MNRNRTFALILGLAALTAALTLPALAHDDDPDARHIKLVLVDGGDEPFELELDELEVGQTEQHYTDTGEEVLVSRDEKGYLIEVGEKKIRIPEIGGHHALIDIDVEGGHGEHVIVNKKVQVIRGEGGGEDVHVIHGGDGEASARVKVVRLGHGEDEGDHGPHVKVIRLGEGEGEDVDVELLGERIKVELLEALDCEEGDEDCEAKVHRLHLGEGGGEDVRVLAGDGSHRVIVIERRHEEEGDEDE